MADRKSPKLTKNADGYYDWDIANGKTQWVEDGEQAAQHTLERLSISYGESDSHPTIGTRIFQIILKADKSRAEKEMEIKRVILGTPGNISIEKFSWNLNDSTHVLTIDGAVKHEWGITDITASLTYL